MRTHRIRARRGVGFAALIVLVGGCTSTTQPLDLSGIPTTLSIVTGDQQFGVVGSVLGNQLVVSLTDNEGRPVPAREVRWTTVGGAVSPAIDSTDDAGQASTRWTLPTTPGDYTTVANVAGVGAVLFSARATQGGSNPTISLIFRYIDAGSYHSCGITTTEELFCWGYNGDGQLGLSASAPHQTPTVIPMVERFRLVSGGRFHSCGLTLSGEPLCFGEGKDGRLGLGADDPITYQAVMAGLVHSCGLSHSLEVWCWGYAGDGELGDGLGVPGAFSRTPVLAGANFRTVAVGGLHSCATRADGVVLCWGFNGQGELGTGDQTIRLGPSPVVSPVLFQVNPRIAPPPPDPDFPLPAGPLLATGYSHSCALGADGNTYCWGLNENGQLGDGTIASRLLPVQVAGGQSFVRITAGFGHTCGLTSAGAAFCWGDNTFGQIGDGTNATQQTTPRQVVGNHTFAYLSAGDLSTCGVTTVGVGYCWGNNEFGQLGDGTLTNSNIPIKVAGQP